jgi:hypothetical protein
MPPPDTRCDTAVGIAKGKVEATIIETTPPSKVCHLRTASTPSDDKGDDIFGSPVSTLDGLRARTRSLRRTGSMKIAETRDSLQASSLSVQFSLEAAVAQAPPAWEESTVETVSSRTWTESPPSSDDGRRHRSIPLQVLLRDPDNGNCGDIAPPFVPFDHDLETRSVKLLQQENEILKLKVELLENKNTMQVQRDLAALRAILNEKSRARKANRMGVALLMPVVLAFCILRAQLVHEAGEQLLSHGLMEAIRKRVALQFHPFLEVRPLYGEPKRGLLKRLFLNMKHDESAVLLKQRKKGNF